MTRRLILFWPIFFTSLYLCGCQPAPISTQAMSRAVTDSHLSIYVNHASAPDYRLAIKEVALKNADLWLSCQTRNHVPKHTSRQTLVAVDRLPAATYDAIRFRVEVSSMDGVLLRSEQIQLPISPQLQLKESGSQCLFIHCHLSLAQLEHSLSHYFSVVLQQKPLADNLLYVLCPEIRTLYLVRTDRLTVTSAFPLQGDICDMVVDNDQRLIYLLDRSHQQILRWDGISQQLTDRITLPMAQSPDNLEISGEGDALFITDPVNRQLIKIDAENGSLLAWVQIGHEPSQPYWFEHDGQQRLAVLSRGDQELLLVNTSTLATIASTPAGQQLSDSLYADRTLYISDAFDRQIVLLDPDDGSIEGRIPTLGQPGAMIDDDVNRSIVIAQQGTKSLAVLPYGQRLVARTVNAGNTPCDLAISTKRRLLFVADSASQSVFVVDLPSEKTITTIEVGSTPNVLTVQEP